MSLTSSSPSNKCGNHRPFTRSFMFLRQVTQLPGTYVPIKHRDSCVIITNVGVKYTKEKLTHGGHEVENRYPSYAFMNKLFAVILPLDVVVVVVVVYTVTAFNADLS